MPDQFPTVWYTTPGKFRSPVKMIVFDDTGKLELRPGEFQFACPMGMFRGRLVVE